MRSTFPPGSTTYHSYIYLFSLLCWFANLRLRLDVQLQDSHSSQGYMLTCSGLQHGYNKQVLSFLGQLTVLPHPPVACWGPGNEPEPFVRLQRPFACTCLCFGRPRHGMIEGDGCMRGMNPLKTRNGNIGHIRASKPYGGQVIWSAVETTQKSFLLWALGQAKFLQMSCVLNHMEVS